MCIPIITDFSIQIVRNENDKKRLHCEAVLEMRDFNETLVLLTPFLLNIKKI